MKIETVIGDVAYLEKDIEYANPTKIQLVSKLNSNITRGKRKKGDEFEFNKHVGICKPVHMAIRSADWYKNQSNKQLQHSITCGFVSIFALNLKRIITLLNRKK